MTRPRRNASSIGHFPFQSVPAIQGDGIESRPSVVVRDDDLLLIGFQDQFQLDQIGTHLRRQVYDLIPIGLEALECWLRCRRQLRFVRGGQAQQIAEGRFSLDLPAGDYVIEIRADGYRNQRRRARIEDGGVTVLNVELQRVR